jgi:hypothetical protein
MDRHIASELLTNINIMKNAPLINPASFIAAIAILGVGCVSHQYAHYQSQTVVEPPPPSPAVVYVSTRPPAPPVESVIVTPGPGYFWVGGAWYWENRWVWHREYWMRPPRAGAVWVRPYYGYRRGYYAWHRGYWR